MDRNGEIEEIEEFEINNNQNNEEPTPIIFFGEIFSNNTNLKKISPFTNYKDKRGRIYVIGHALYSIWDLEKNWELVTYNYSGKTKNLYGWIIEESFLKRILKYLPFNSLDKYKRNNKERLKILTITNNFIPIPYELPSFTGKISKVKIQGDIHYVVKNPQFTADIFSGMDEELLYTREK